MERHWTKFEVRKVLSVGCVLLMAGMGSAVFAQAPAPPPPAAQGQAAFAPQQLDDLVAPIALYPDPLLGQVLAASTYPVELVEAQQWEQANGSLQGQQRVDAAKEQNWDASVQAMVAMPDVLAKLTQDVHWTTDLGNAFLAQPADVMAAVQRMRARAQANGKLQTNQQETVSTESQDGQQAIQIQPADPQVVYVPYYDPAYVWGAPVWGEYPPLAYPYYGLGWYPGINIGLYFGGGWGGWGGWGWGPNWFGGGLYMNVGFFNHYGYRYGGIYGGRFGGGFRGNTAWMHDPSHRMGAGYSNARLNARYGAASQAARMESGRTGNYHSFGSAGNSYRGSNYGSTAGRNYGSTAGRSYGSTAGRSYGSTAGRSYGTQGAGGYQHFQGGRQTYQAPAQRSYSNGGQRYSAPSAQHYSAPAQHYSAPAQHYSAPSGGGGRSYGGGGGARSYGGGGGHSSGGGGGHSGGGGHGGRR